jgi:tRNA (guanine37-N1)-methyltransferase
MRFDIVTVFPEMLRPFFSQGILLGAQEKGLIEIHLHDLRVFSPDPRGIVDDRPFGGGAGMVMRPEPFFRAVEAITQEIRAKPFVVLLSAQGVLFNQDWAKKFAQKRTLFFFAAAMKGWTSASFLSVI